MMCSVNGVNIMYCAILGYILLTILTVLNGQCLRTCKLPHCRCPSLTPPADLPVHDIPQIVSVVFSGTVDADFLKLHNKTFPTHPPKSRRNPNNCPMTSTIFVRGKGTDYCAVNRLYAYGHEIGQNGQARRNEDFWGGESTSEFIKDLTSINKKLVDEAKVPKAEIYGTRTPVYKASDNYLLTAEELEYEYDSSIIISRSTQQTGEMGTPVTFPYTLDHVFNYDSEFSCTNQQCPQEEFSLWEVPVRTMVNEDGQACRDLTTCGNATELDEGGVAALLLRNFDMYYPTKVPFLINIDIGLLKLDTSGNFIKGMNIFLDDVSSLDDVWIVGLHQAVAWMKSPRRTGETEALPAWGCQTHLLDRCTVMGLDESEMNKASNATTDDEYKNTIKGLFPDGKVLVLWQTIILIALYLAIWHYDKVTIKKK